MRGEYFFFSNVNYTDQCEALITEEWNDVFSDDYDFDGLYDKWHKRFRQILETIVPHRSVTIRPCDKPWMNSEVRRTIRKRDRLFKYLCKWKTFDARESYRVQRNFTTSFIRDRKKSFSCIGPKKWWGIVKSLYGNNIKCNVPTLCEGDQLITAKEKLLPY